MGLVESGQTVVDIGCGLGYSSLSMAELVGPEGRVITFDVQQQMADRAKSRAKQRGLANRIDFRACAQDRLGLDRLADFALAFWVVHEEADPAHLLTEVSSCLTPGGRLLIVEPKGHVSAARFADTVDLARTKGFEVSEGPRIRLSRSITCSPRA